MKYNKKQQRKLNKLVGTKVWFKADEFYPREHLRVIEFSFSDGIAYFSDDNDGGGEAPIEDIENLNNLIGEIK